MAIYRFEAKVISRGGGRSAVASASYRTGKFANSGKSAVSAAAYRAGAELEDERTGQRYDYTNKRGVLGAEIMAPAGAALWTRDRQELWAAVERIEKRRDAQLARDFILTLPHELDHAQRVALTREFVREQFCARGLVADVAWHAPGKGGDERNYHAHVMVPLRRLEGERFAARKDRPAGPEHPAKAWAVELERLRVEWANTANRHLAAAGLDIRLDHRSLAERGIDREPEPKQGPLATQIERQGRESLAGRDRRAVQELNAERAALKVEIAAAAAAEAQLVDLVTHRLRSGEMKPAQPTEEELRQQQEREAEGLRQMAAQDRQLQEFRRQQEAQAEEARRQRDRLAAEERRRRSDGDIADPQARYGIALADSYCANDPYGSLAEAAMKEYGAFLQGQERLKAEIAREQDGEKRRVIELRREIEAHDYMAITSQRLAGISATLAGREDAPQAQLDRARAEAYAARAAELREERRELIAAQERQRGQGRKGAARPAQPARPSEQEAQEPSRRDRETKREDAAARGRPAGRKEQDGELTDAQREKLDRLRALNEAYAEQDAQRQQDKDRGGGKGRGGR